MASFADKSKVTWNVHFSSSPEKVYKFINTDEGRKKWWSGSSTEKDGILNLGFASFPIIERAQNRYFKFTYIGNTTDVFTLTPTPDGGTDLNITESGIPTEEHFLLSFAGWVEVLLVLKGAVDFDIDLRNGFADKTWENNFVDV
jgi:hypothetical protein